MKRSLLIALAAVLLSAILASPGNTQRLGSSQDEDAIKAIIVEMIDGFNKHDAKAATRMYTPQADLVTARGDAFKGTVEFEKGLAAILTTRAKNATLKTLDMRIRFIRPDVALAHVTNELSGLVNTDGAPLPSQKEHSIRVFVKNDGVWSVEAFHNTMIAPFGSSQPQR